MPITGVLAPPWRRSRGRCLAAPASFVTHGRRGRLCRTSPNP